MGLELDHSRQPCQALGQPPGVGVVVGEPPDHPSRPGLERNEPGRGKDPGLAHSAADQLAGAARRGDELTRADDDRADRAGEAFGKAERHRISRIAKVTGRDAEGYRGVEQAGTVDVERHSAEVSDCSDLGCVARRQRLSHRQVVRVLENHEGCGWLVDVARIPEGAVDGSWIDRAVGSHPNGSRRGAHDDRMAAGLPVDDVRSRSCDELKAPPEMRQHRDQVAHRPGNDEQAGVLAEQRRRTLLQGVDRRVFAEDVVADVRRCHRSPHLLRGLGHRVGAQVDHSSSVGLGRRGTTSAQSRPSIDSPGWWRRARSTCHL